MKAVICLTYAILIIICILNALKVDYDVRLSSFIPENTQEYRYLEAQNKYFGFYNFYLVTTELEYPLNQPLLYEYHSSLTKVAHVLKDSNGGLDLNDFWLANFRDYLTDLQLEFDLNRAKNHLTNENWYSNATEKAVLAFKLLAQTGVVEFPVDKSQIFTKKLVDKGIIDPKAFYNYLSVWSSNDQMSYTSSQANLSPKPFPYYTSKAEVDLKIPKSQPLVYTQMPFYLKNLRSTSKIISTLKQIKCISETYNNKGLKNYPVGLIFSYFNHFLNFDKMLLVQLALTVFLWFSLDCIVVHWTKLWCPLFNILATLLVMAFLNVNAFTGVMGAVLFILVGRNTMLVLSGYLTALGSRDRRLRLSFELNVEPILKGDLGLLICISVLATSHFEFIKLHMFLVVIIAVSSSTLNALVFFPVILNLIGPKSELQTTEHTDRISTPPPSVQPPAPKRESSYNKPRRSNQGKATREPSLTTITEESCNQSIVVEPQVTVEYSSPESSSSSCHQHTTTKVTATANIKVELVAPVYRSKCSAKCHRTKCTRKQQQQAQCKCCKDSDSDNESCMNS